MVSCMRLIVKFFKEHNIVFSLRTLKSRLKEYELRRTRNDNNLEKAYYSISSHFQDPGSLQGYRSVWHGLRCSWAYLYYATVL